MNFGNILISSAAGKVSLLKAMQEAARRINPEIKVFAGDIDERALTRFVADAFWQMPATTEAEVTKLLLGCKERNIRVILPTRDAELVFWAKQKKLFAENNIAVIVSSAEAVQRCMDKLAFSDFAQQQHLPFIRAGLKPEKAKDARYVVKERFGAGSRNIGINLSLDEAQQHAKLLKEPLFQFYVGGKEISIDAWLDAKSNVKGLVLRRRDKVVNGESQVTTTFRNEALEKTASDILHKLQLSGPVVMQAIIQAPDTMNVVECNARFGGASTAAIAVGLDSLFWSLLQAYDLDLASHPFDRAAADICQLRLPSDVIMSVDDDFNF